MRNRGCCRPRVLSVIPSSRTFDSNNTTHMYQMCYCDMAARCPFLVQSFLPLVENWKAQGSHQPLDRLLHLSHFVPDRVGGGLRPRVDRFPLGRHQTRAVGPAWLQAPRVHRLVHLLPGVLHVYWEERADHSFLHHLDRRAYA